MRLIGTLNTEPQAKLFSANLKRKGIESSVDGKSVWVHNEDQLIEAGELLSLFQKDPSHSQFEMPLIEVADEEEELPEVEALLAPRRSGHITAFLIAFCSLIYFLGALQEVPFIEKGIPPNAFVPTPIQITMLFDVPPAMEKLEQMVTAYNPPAEQKPPPLPAEIARQIDAVNKTPYWRGLSEILLLKIKGEDASIAKGPLFEKIREGEFWRLLSPVFLHGSILHILFNMLWVWILGKQIEQRVGVWRYLLLTVIVGVFANVVQYLASGPFFLGYSGIVLGLAGFIWSRERIAKWEGYPLQRNMLLFLALFVLAMSALQLVSFIVLFFSLGSFEPNIANSAHIAGAVIGAILGRLSYFAARPAL